MTAPFGVNDPATIVAIATPSGRGGIGIVRLSGPQSFRIVKELTGAAPQPRIATYRILRDASGHRIDDAVVTYFAAPHSYTGEDVVEIAVHGSPVVLDWLVRSAGAAGAQPARAGEFTERAFLSGRLDLTQAEAVRDLIDAQTLGQAQLAARQMGGSIAEQVRPAKQTLIELIATLEAGIDFAEDDIDTLPASVIRPRIAALLPPLETLLKSFAHGRLLREGLRLAIVGKPNAGKSSLFNRLVERDRAIVTSTPGTTRDVIAERISLDGIPIELLDTAGLRETDDEAERMGVARSREAIADADAILLVVDTTPNEENGPPRKSVYQDTYQETFQSALQNTSQDALPDTFPNAFPDTLAVAFPDALLDTLRGRAVLVAQNKIDRTGAPALLDLPWPIIPTSALTGEGIEALRAALLQLARGNASNAGEATLTNLRQRDAVAASITALRRAQAATTTSTPHEMLLLDLYEALQALDELTGQTTPDDILNRIFSTFCIGK